MFFLDLKRAEVAIRSGRLDEAFHVLQTSSGRAHRDGQRLVDRLVAGFVDRATEHLTENRIDDARHDADRAQQLGGRLSAVTELQKKISVADADRRQCQQHRGDVLESARQQMLSGAYSVSAKLLDGLDVSPSAADGASERLAASIETRRVVVDDAVVRIRAATAAGDFESAVAIIGGLHTDQRTREEIVALTQEATGPLVERAFQELSAGRIDRAAVIDHQLQSFQASVPRVRELQQCLARCRSARKYLEEHRYAEAESQLSVLAQVVDGGTWIDQARTAVAGAIRDLNSVSAGPLGLLNEEQGSEPISAMEVLPVSQRMDEARQFSGEGLPRRSVLQVDGVGGLLLLSADVVTIGTTSSSARIDVPLVTEGTEEMISIRRDSDDYFAEAARPFRVNGREETRKLLTSGDSIALGARGRLRFLKPVAASGSAVLQITGARLARRDIRSIVLMSDSLLFGPTGSHFRLPGTDSPVVLHCSRGGYALRESVSRESASQQAGRAVPAALDVGESVVLQDIRFALMDG